MTKTQFKGYNYGEILSKLSILIYNHALTCILNKGTLASTFPVTVINSLHPKEFRIEDDMVGISKNFNENGKPRLFENAGLMQNYIGRDTPVFYKKMWAETL